MFCLSVYFLTIALQTAVRILSRSSIFSWIYNHRLPTGIYSQILFGNNHRLVEKTINNRSNSLD
jgi:hypothetical protein